MGTQRAEASIKRDSRLPKDPMAAKFVMAIQKLKDEKDQPRS
jgi:hypothetical protein